MYIVKVAFFPQRQHCYLIFRTKLDSFRHHSELIAQLCGRQSRDKWTKKVGLKVSKKNGPSVEKSKATCMIQIDSLVF
jgi:hypothetical protein